MFKKIIIALCLSATLYSTQSFAYSPPDEGMWLPLHLQRLNYADMQKMGLKLTAEELYSINKSSLKDAIVSLGGFCTGEIISSQGLLLTNHHCGFDAIQTHSSVANDYLTNGFWAMRKEDEKPNEGLTAAFVIRIEDVSSQVLSQLNDQMSETERATITTQIVAKIKENAQIGTQYNAQVKSFFNGNEYYLFVYETFKDVRLVGAPPSAIGKFGGDTDNWMWPRHTGDFSLFRVYSGPDGKPAEYSPNNIPLVPRHHLPISLAGIKEDDFSMIFGFPGRTDRYLTSFGVDLAVNLTNPARVKIREKKLALMKQDMDRSAEIRIKYASNYAQVSNYWKYFIGQTQGLKRLKVADKKRAEEKAFALWVAARPDRTAKYGKVLGEIENAYNTIKQYQLTTTFFQEAAMGAFINEMAITGISLEEYFAQQKENPEAIKQFTEQILPELDTYFKDYNQATDQNIYAAMLRYYKSDIPADQLPDVFKTIETKYKNDFDAYARQVYASSVFASKEKAKAFFSKPDEKILKADLGFMTIKSIYNKYVGLQQTLKTAQQQLDRANRLYVGGTMEMDKDTRKFYPNANSTLRLTYGKVMAYDPRDAVHYKYFATLDGIMEKEDSTNDEFIVPKRLKELYKAKDYGQYGENGVLPVAFISNNDITGGNSGSPVINGSGHLIGTAFDGNWEAMSGDIAFEPKYQRTISVDIRYTLFVIDKFAGAGHLINEMSLIKTPSAPASKPSQSQAPGSKSNKKNKGRDR